MGSPFKCGGRSGPENAKATRGKVRSRDGRRTPRLRHEGDLPTPPPGWFGQTRMGEEGRQACRPPWGKAIIIESDMSCGPGGPVPGFPGQSLGKP